MKENKFSPVRASVLAAMGLGFALASASVAAGVTWYSPISAFEDDNLDWLIDNDNDGLISIGDRLVSVLEFNNSQGIISGQGPDSILPDELTGVADITVLSKIEVLPGLYALTFGPSTSGLLTGGSATVGSETVTAVANIAGAMAVLWLDDSPDLNVINGACGSFAQCVAAASDGTPNPYVAFGITNADTDTYWATLGTDDPAFIASLPASEKPVSINFQLQMLVNNTGQIFGVQACTPSPLAPGRCGSGDGFVDLIGSADILGGQGLENLAFARSDTDAQLARIPEPGSLALLGLGLAGLAASTRRRKARS